MKVAIVGGGTAGYMAAAHITRYYPHVELYHIYDSRIPTIGVGEGTWPRFRFWIHELTKLSYEELSKKCDITRKYSISFENWGKQQRQFMHDFFPINKEHAYHISADQLTDLLKAYSKTNYIDKRVKSVQKDSDRASIQFEDETSLELDYVLDATGFPKDIKGEHTEFKIIPTNAAYIKQGPPVASQTFTRAIARPFGWVFTIPLTTRTSYGYVFNTEINSKEEIEADMSELLKEEGVSPSSKSRWLSFPNFSENIFFDGRIFKIGNAASFLEPLEATAIHLTLYEIRLFCHYVLERTTKKNKKNSNSISAMEFVLINKSILSRIIKLSLFIAWHYAKGSRYDTEFWRYAEHNYHYELRQIRSKDILKSFDKYLHDGSECPHTIEKEKAFLKQMASMQEEFRKMQNENGGKLITPPGFAGFINFSFAQIGYGIGYY